MEGFRNTTTSHKQNFYYENCASRQFDWFMDRACEIIRFEDILLYQLLVRRKISYLNLKWSY